MAMMGAVMVLAMVVVMAVVTVMVVVSGGDSGSIGLDGDG